MPNKNSEGPWVVRVSGDVRSAGTNQTFGPFLDYRRAEECVIALSTRTAILSAKIEQVQGEI